MTEQYDDTGLRVWHEAVAQLLASGRTSLEALDGANMILAAWKRQHEKAQAQGSTLEPGSDEGDSMDDDSGVRVWQDAAASLVADRRTPTEAFVGANLILEAWRRHREEAQEQRGTHEQGSVEEDSMDEDSGVRVWQDAAASLTADHRRTPTEAFVGANLIRDAWKRHRKETQKRGGGSGPGSPDGCSAT
jgi:hypothetical protein